MYETLSYEYVNHIVAWYFRPVQGSFNHETFTQNRNSFAKPNTPILPVYLKQIFLRIPVEGLLFYIFSNSLYARILTYDIL